MLTVDNHLSSVNAAQYEANAANQCKKIAQVIRDRNFIYASDVRFGNWLSG